VCFYNEKGKHSRGDVCLICRTGSAAKNLAGALRTEAVAYILSVVREVK
jgi:hypothetical protein